jgi:hypothetical protein
MFENYQIQLKDISAEALYKIWADAVRAEDKTVPTKVDVMLMTGWKPEQLVQALKDASTEVKEAITRALHWRRSFLAQTARNN